MQFSVTVRNARLDAIETTIGGGSPYNATLRIFDGTLPADCATADNGTILVEMYLPSDWMNTASSGSKTKNGTWSGTAVASGTADYFRIYDDASPYTCHVQGTVNSTSDSPAGDMVLQQGDTSISSGQDVTVSTFTLTDGNA